MQNYIGAPELCAKIGITRMTLHRWLQNEAMNFPKPARLGGYRYWPIAEVEAWINARRG